MGRSLNNMGIKGQIPWNKGLRYSESLKTKLNLRGLKIGQIRGEGNPKYNKESHKICIECDKKVWRRSERCKECFSKWKFQIKENHPRWKGGITSENRRFRSKIEWKKWREAVFARDNFICKECGMKNCFLEPHHIIPIRSDKNNVYNINNGITLCRPCHKKTIWKESDFAEKYSRLVAAQVK